MRLSWNEIGHAFGLRHTNRDRFLMQKDADRTDWDFAVFIAAEENATRRAYRAGRGARYCGNPDACGNGYAPGYTPALDLDAPIALD